MWSSADLFLEHFSDVQDFWWGSNRTSLKSRIHSWWWRKNEPDGKESEVNCTILNLLWCTWDDHKPHIRHWIYCDRHPKAFEVITPNQGLNKNTFSNKYRFQLCQQEKDCCASELHVLLKKKKPNFFLLFFFKWRVTYINNMFSWRQVTCYLNSCQKTCMTEVKKNMTKKTNKTNS